MKNPLEQAQALVLRTLELCCGHKAEVVNDGKRLVVDGLWSLFPRGKGWMILRKYEIPEEAKPNLTEPRDFDYVPVWKSSQPLFYVLHALAAQFNQLRLEGGMEQIKKEVLS